MWGHPHDFTPPSSIQSAAFPHNCLHTHLRTNPDNGRLTVTVALSRSLCLYLTNKMAL